MHSYVSLKPLHAFDSKRQAIDLQKFQIWLPRYAEQEFRASIAKNPTATCDANDPRTT